MSDVRTRYRGVLEQISAACERVGRDADDVTVVAVSKSQPVSAIRAAMEAGCLDFGENRVQDWRDKARTLSRRIRWHFIGHLQRNKAKFVVDEIALLHSLDSLSLVETIERQAQSPHDVLVEVNLAGEAQKSGVSAAAALDLVRQCARSPVVRPVGLMCIPPWAEAAESSRRFYQELAQLHRQISADLREIDPILAVEFRELSMGMSGDFEVAVEEGATLVRIGTAIFGPRGGPPG